MLLIEQLLYEVCNVNYLNFELTLVVDVAFVLIVILKITKSLLLTFSAIIFELKIVDVARRVVI